MAENSLLGGLIGVVGGKSTDDKLKQVLSWPRAQGALNSIIKGIGSQQWKDALAKYTGQQEAYQPTRLANVPEYQEQYRNLFNAKSPGIEDFTAAIGAAFAPIREHSKNIVDYGLARIKGLQANQGRGNQGPSAYDTILNSTNSAINMANAMAPAYASVAPYFANMAAGRQSDFDRQLGLLAGDYLNAPADAAAQSNFLPFLAQRQLQGVDLDLLGRAGEMQRGNVAGWQTIPGLKSRIDAADEGVWNTVKNAASVYGSLMGTSSLGGMMGGGTQTASTAPSTNFLQNDYFAQAQQPSYSAPAMQSLYPTSSYGAVPSNALQYNYNTMGLSPAFQQARANPFY